MNPVVDLLTEALTGRRDFRDYGAIGVQEDGDYLLLNYLPEAQYKRLWTPYERVCRGLIFDLRQGVVAARPFDKFFNWGEETTTARLKRVTEKMDGSLGILYYRGDDPCIATRGSFNSPQAVWATEHLRRQYKTQLRAISPEWTLLFEIIYPENRVVVHYDFEGLVLLAARHRFTGDYHPTPEGFGFRTPKVYDQLSDPYELLTLCKTLSANAEGFVGEFEDGQRFKFKGLSYLQIHKALFSFSRKTVFTAMREGTFWQYLSVLPDELSAQALVWQGEILMDYTALEKATLTAFSHAPKHDRKTFALFIQQQKGIVVSAAFAMLDNKPYAHLLWKALVDNDV